MAPGGRTVAEKVGSGVLVAGVVLASYAAGHWGSPGLSGAWLAAGLVIALSGLLMWAIAQYAKGR